LFAATLQRLRDERGISERQLCDQIGQAPTYFQAFNKGTAKKLPAFEVMVEIARALGVRLDEMLGTKAGFDLSLATKPRTYLEKQADRMAREISRVVQAQLESVRPSLDAVLDWIDLTDGKIHQDNQMWQYIDLHAVPEVTDRILIPQHVGANSLAGQRLGAPNPQLLMRMMETLPEDQMTKVLMSYREVTKRPYEITTQYIEVEMPDHFIRFKTRYRRLLHPVEDAQGNKYILCYTTLANGPDERS